ncbi:hypothetical protein MP228_001907 [Amoeboaphelidium protococcarum]|nr:hypothetical protein MP228_001907 [Amoeboaphelidium protococcarum]
MIKINRKPSSKRAKRELEKREPKIIEDPKHCLVLKGKHTSEMVNGLLRDLHALKKPHSTLLHKKNDINLFEDTSSIEFLCDKNDDSSLFILGNHMKKRPHTITIGRLFDGRVLDFVELQVMHHVSIDDFTALGDGKSSAGYKLGVKRVMTFHGDGWSMTGSEQHQLLKNVLFDLFNVEPLEKISFSGVDSVIAASLDQDGILDIRVYSVLMRKSSDGAVPYIQLENAGPFIQGKVVRFRDHESEVWHKATRVPAEVKPKKIKNVDKDILGTTIGTVHVDKQDLNKLQTRKMKGLKRSRDEKQSAEDGIEEDEEIEEDDNEDEDSGSEEEIEQETEEISGSTE